MEHLSRSFKQVGVEYAEPTSSGNLVSRDHEKSKSIHRPVETSRPVGTPVAAKRVVVASSPPLDERTAPAVNEYEMVDHLSASMYIAPKGSFIGIHFERGNIATGVQTIS